MKKPSKAGQFAGLQVQAAKADMGTDAQTPAKMKPFLPSSGQQTPQQDSSHLGPAFDESADSKMKVFDLQQGKKPSADALQESSGKPISLA